MSDTMRCPFGGWTGAARPIRRGGEPAEGVIRGTASAPADAYECDACRQVWTEQTAPKPVDATS